MINPCEGEQAGRRSTFATWPLMAGMPSEAVVPNCAKATVSPRNWSGAPVVAASVPLSKSHCPVIAAFAGIDRPITSRAQEAALTQQIPKGITKFPLQAAVWQPVILIRRHFGPADAGIRARAMVDVQPSGIGERCEEQYVVYHSVDLSRADLDSFAEKPVRFVQVDRRGIRAKHLKLHALQSLPECLLQGGLQQGLANPLATEARFHSHAEPANMRHPFKGR